MTVQSSHKQAISLDWVRLQAVFVSTTLSFAAI